MATTLPSEFRLIPARAGLNAVADPQRRNLQAGTAILNLKRLYFIDAKKSYLPISFFYFGACRMFVKQL